MKEFAFILLSFLIFYSSYGQAERSATLVIPDKVNKRIEKFYSGEIVLNDGTEINSDFFFNPLFSEGLIKIQEGNRLKVYTANQVNYFKFYDEKAERKRVFFSIPVTVRNNIFMELVYEGSELSFFGRESVDLLVDSNGGTVVDIRNSYSSYIYKNETQEFIQFTKKTMYEVMNKKQDEIRDFVKKEKIKLKKVKNIKKVFEYYDSLIKSDK